MIEGPTPVISRRHLQNLFWRRAVAPRIFGVGPAHPIPHPTSAFLGRVAIMLFVVFASLCFRPTTTSAREGCSFESQGTLFYTDDVGLFSATRRLSRDGDPTQPAIDSSLTNRGSDMVFEPLFNANKSLTNGLGQLDLNVRGQGFIFTTNPEFNHGTLRVQAIQDLSSTVRVKARYYYAPSQFLGNNEERRSGHRRTRRRSCERTRSEAGAPSSRRTEPTSRLR